MSAEPISRGAVISPRSYLPVLLILLFALFFQSCSAQDVDRAKDDAAAAADITRDAFAIDLMGDDGKVVEVPCDAPKTPAEYAKIIRAYIFDNEDPMPRGYGVGFADVMDDPADPEDVDVTKELEAQQTRWDTRCSDTRRTAAVDPSTVWPVAPYLALSDRMREFYDSQRSLGSCPTQFVQKDIEDVELSRPIKGGHDAKTAEKSRDELLEQIGHAAPQLRYYAVDGLHLNNVPDVEQLVTENGKCLSRKGQDLYRQVEGALMASGVEFVDAPADVYNTGWVNNEPTVAETPGVNGDNTKTLEVTLPNDTKMLVLVRCGNLLLPSQPKHIPVGKTDNPPKKDKPATPVTTQPPIDWSKNEADEPQRQGNVPTPVQGPGAGLPAPSSEPPAVSRPSSDYVYTPPAPPTSEPAQPTPSGPAPTPPPREQEPPPPEEGVNPPGPEPTNPGPVPVPED